jgi:ubiquinone/menaquinone biosynthesis C-methylase UbiE
VDHADLVALLRPAVTTRGGHWADLGAGEGAFTLALAELLGPDARITAVDKDARALRTIGHGIETRAADFTKPLGLRDLDGVVMANSLHFVRNKQPVLAAVREMLKPGAPLIVVEYATDRGNPWVPHPFSFETWRRLAAEAGLTGTALVATVPSRYFGAMYSAFSLSPRGEGRGEGARRPA